MKRINKEGPRILSGFRRPEPVSESEVPALLARGATVVDTRLADDFARAHIPGTINIPLDRSFTTWAGWLVPYDRDFYLIANAGDSVRAVDVAARDLAMIGLDRLVGYFESEVVDRWVDRGGEPGTIPLMTPHELHSRFGAASVVVIDVRGSTEWEAGHLPGVENIPVGYLGERAGELPRDRPLVLHCQSGSRSAIAASMLRARGFTNVVNLTGGFAEWQRLGYPVEWPGARAGGRLTEVT